MKYLSFLLLIVGLTAVSGATTSGGTGGFVTLDLDGPTSTTKYYSICGTYTYFKVNMPYPCSDLNVQVFPSSGEPDIYVSKANLDQDPNPTKNKLSWAAYADGEYNLTISHWDPESSPGWYYIGIYDDCSKQSHTASYTIRAYTSEDNADDILVNKKLSMNKVIAASDYTYYRFCVKSCADVKVTLQNCLSYEECGQSYSYPELLVTRTDRAPTIYSYSYKLAQIVRRFVLVNHTDPSSRDHNGFMTGSYYVGVYGWCTSDEFVTNNKTDGPCSFAANTIYNVTVEVNYIPSSSCDASHLKYSSAPPMQKITSGQVIHGVVPVKQYVYYSIDVLDPCETLNIWTGNSSDPAFSVPELAVGKWPELNPTFDNLQWTSYDWTAQNLTISAWDADFDGGKVCGPYKNATCTYIIGVLGYASISSIKTVEFTLMATLTPQHKIFGNPQLNQRIAPYGMNQYAFCVRSEDDVSAELVSWSTELAAQCPSSYSSLEMVISRTNSLATTSDLVWRLGHGETTTNAIYLFHNDADTKLGSYYLNVLGYCTACTNPKSCAPCSNLNNTRYAVVVSNNILFNATSDRQKYLGSCPATSSSTTTTTSGGSSRSSDSLSDGAKAGIVIAVVFIVIVIGVILYFAVTKKEHYSNPNSELARAADEDADQGTVLASNPVTV